METHADNDRTTLSLTGTYNPFTWLSNRLVAGLDVNAENNWLLYPRQPLGTLDPLGTNGLGNKNVTRTAQNFLTLDYAGSAKYSFRDRVDFTTPGEDWGKGWIKVLDTFDPGAGEDSFGVRAQVPVQGLSLVVLRRAH